ncbi:MAG: hypothetical protein ACKOBP_10640 [Planctomycetia bacterium]
MGELHLILFTLLWTIVWVAPVPRLSPRVELVAGLIPFVAFGLRVFAGFFAGVPDTDPVRTAVGPLLNWVAGTAGAVPYAVVLDATVALGLVWFAAAFDIPRKSRIATAWIMPAVAIASLASQRLAGQPLERVLVSHLPTALLAGLLGAMIAAVLALTPSDIPNTLRRRAALVALAVTPLAAGLGAAVLGLLGTLPTERQAAAASIAALATGVVAGLVALLTCGFTRPRSRWLFAMAIGVAAGATVGPAAAR